MGLDSVPKNSDSASELAGLGARLSVIVTGETQAGTAHIANLRCPVCRREGAFHGFPNISDVLWRVPNGTDRTGRPQVVVWQAGSRRCPNKECNALVYVTTAQGLLVESFPPQVLDFDATSLPGKVQSSLEEAVKCHSAGCYSAAALMVRKTLENLCEDKQATGANLKQRITNLRSMIVISDDLLTAADELRLLGNDAAHVEAQAYDAIEAEEVEVAIELTKELLKAVYQHTSLVARLRALKIPPTTP